MVTIIAHHRVKDFTVWKPHYDADKPRRMSAGVQDLEVGTRKDDPQDVYMIWKAENQENVNRMIHDPGLKEIMDKAGVITKPEFIVLNE